MAKARLRENWKCESWPFEARVEVKVGSSHNIFRLAQGHVVAFVDTDVEEAADGVDEILVLVLLSRHTRQIPKAEIDVELGTFLQREFSELQNVVKVGSDVLAGKVIGKTMERKIDLSDAGTKECFRAKFIQQGSVGGEIDLSALAITLI